MQGGASNSVVVFTLVGDERGNKGVVIRHHAYANTGNPLEFMHEFCVWDGGGNVAIAENHILSLETARGVWNRFVTTRPSPSYRAWVGVSPDPYTVNPDGLIARLGDF